VRRPIAVAATLSAAVLTSCTGSGSDGVSPYCAKLIGASKRLTSAQADLYRGGSGGHAALTRIVTELNGLRDGAPSESKAALADMASAFASAEQLVQNPASAASTQLAKVARQLSADGKRISAYATSKCH
jgi:hypothetical protein